MKTHINKILASTVDTAVDMAHINKSTLPLMA